MNILSSPRITSTDAHVFSAEFHPEAHVLIDLYWTMAPEIGVRPEVAYCQMLKETGFLKFGRAVTIDQHNPCGLKVTNPGADDARSSHASFPTWVSGVTAHLDHLALYAGHPDYPAHNTPDPRHFHWLHGRAPRVEDLGGRWAPSPTYGKNIVAMVKLMAG